MNPEIPLDCIGARVSGNGPSTSFVWWRSSNLQEISCATFLLRTCRPANLLRERKHCAESSDSRNHGALCDSCCYPRHHWAAPSSTQQGRTQTKGLPSWSANSPNHWQLASDAHGEGSSSVSEMGGRIWTGLLSNPRDQCDDRAVLRQGDQGPLG